MNVIDEQLKHLPAHIRQGLLREELIAQGRCDAFAFVKECRGDVTCIKEKLAWYEDLIANPSDDWKGPLSPNASVRLHKDGYVAGLRDALKILTQPPHDSTHDPTQATAQPPTELHVAQPESASAQTTEFALSDDAMIETQPA